MEERIDSFVERIFDVWEDLKTEYGIDRSTPLVIAPPDDFPVYKAQMLNELFNINYFKPEGFKNGNEAHATTVMHMIPDDDNICHVLCAGVIMNLITVIIIVKNNVENEMLSFVEILLRHEIGHMISMAMTHEGITVEESDALDKKIEMLENDMLSKLDDNISFKDYASLPKEAHANACANVDVNKLIELSNRFDQL